MPPRSYLAALADLGTRGFHVVPDSEHEPTEALPPIDYEPVRAACRHLARWVLDTAGERTSDPIDLAAIKRVSRAIDRSERGAPSTLADEDLLTVAGIVIATLEREWQAPGLSHLAGALYANTAAPVLARVIAQLSPVPRGGVVPKVARTPSVPSCPISISLGHRPCVAHGDDDDRGDPGDNDTAVDPFAFLTFR